jgi:hypothetical protein
LCRHKAFVSLLLIRSKAAAWPPHCKALRPFSWQQSMAVAFFSNRKDFEDDVLLCFALVCLFFVPLCVCAFEVRPA